GVENLTMLSDHRSAQFGTHYGTLIKELRLNCRAIFVIDEEDTLLYVEYVKEVADHPDYEAALEAVREIQKS
ncbi:MAG: lipid hydroperoxide peroxidase, partial [Acidobacteria bacterium]|nr:lipid hydroperoxide peroxidase [Acidobacteriota bacterium]